MTREVVYTKTIYAGNEQVLDDKIRFALENHRDGEFPQVATEIRFLVTDAGLIDGGSSLAWHAMIVFTVESQP